MFASSHTRYLLMMHHKASIALHSAIRSRSPPQKSFLLLSEWLLLVIPLLLSMTLFAHRPGALSAILLLPTTFICFLFPPHQSGTPLPSGGSPRASSVSQHASNSHPHHDEHSKQGTGSPEQTETTRLSALSTYRAHMMIVTVLAILAVDFAVFPRSLAKCETYGVSFVRIFFSCLLPFVAFKSISRWTWALAHLCFPKESFPRSQSYSLSKIHRI